MPKLKIEDLVETVGKDILLESLDDVEILFLTFDEITSRDESPNLSAFAHVPNLKRLAMIDNGLKRISGLEPLASSLLTLTICDQAISTIDHCLNLPNLKELFLHRNQLASLEGLTGCPRLTKLWVFQNKLTNLLGLHALPELEELWIQGNKIERLNGLEMLPELQELALAGNPISDFAQLRKVKFLKKVKSLTCNDVHFGSCPIANEPTYKEFVLCTLKHVRVLDGIVVTKEKQHLAETIYQQQVCLEGFPLFFCCRVPLLLVH
jgi:protein phosphatase 1 regulatory subunit 7